MELFPKPPRDFPGRRWLHVTTRAAHILCVGVLLAGHVFDQPAAGVAPWLVAAAGTGLAMVVIDLHSSFAVACEARGMMVLAKILLVAASLHFWDARVALLIGVLAIGGLGSHAPRGIRHRVLFCKSRLGVKT